MVTSGGKEGEDEVTNPESKAAHCAAAISPGLQVNCRGVFLLLNCTLWYKMAVSFARSDEKKLTISGVWIVRAA